MHAQHAWLPVGLAVGAFLVGASCGSHSEPTAPPRLVVLYATCSLNKNLLAPHDPSIPFTPRLAAFGKESIVFDRHITESGQSGPAFASLFSGIQAMGHGAYRHPIRIGDHLYEITEAFRDAGYDPYFWNGHPMASVDLNYGQGVPPAHAFVRDPRRILEYTANDDDFKAVLDRLRTDPNYKAFVLVNLTLSHAPYSAYLSPEEVQSFLREHPERGRRVTPEIFSRYIAIYEANFQALQWNFPKEIERLGLSEPDVSRLIDVIEVAYEACVRRLDRYFGQFVQSIDGAGFRDDSLIAFTSDHGESLYRESALFHWTHGLQLAPEDLNVTWMLRGPRGMLKPGRYSQVTRSIDVYPTMAGLCGISLPPGAPIEGVDLSRVLLGEVQPPELLAFSHTTTVGPDVLQTFRDWHPLIDFYPTEDVAWIWVRVQEGDRVFQWRNVGQGRFDFEAFDLARDPEERTNLFDRENEQHLRMARLLQEYKGRLQQAYESKVYVGTELSHEDSLRRLKGLGYVGRDQ